MNIDIHSDLKKYIKSLLKDALSDLLTEMNAKEVTPYMTIEEACEYLHLAKPTLYKKVHHQEIPHYKRGKRLYFLRKDLDKHLLLGKRKSIDELFENH